MPPHPGPRAGAGAKVEFWNHKLYVDSKFLNTWEDFITFLGPKGQSLSMNLNSLETMLFRPEDSLTLEGPILKLFQEHMQNDCGAIAPYVSKLYKLFSDGLLLNHVYQITQDVGTPNSQRDAMLLYELNLLMWDQIAECMKDANVHAKEARITHVAYG